MSPAPLAVAFDVNETLFSLDAVASRLRDVGLEGGIELWLARVLRDGMAAAAAGTFAVFPAVARHHVLELLRSRGLAVDEAAADAVIGGFQEVTAHDDVAPAFERLRHAEVRVVTLTNGTAEVTWAFLDRAGLAEHVERAFEVAEAGVWKPGRAPYHHVAASLGVDHNRLALVAVHPWDIHGAKQAGLVAGWADREGAAYPSFFTPPDVVGGSLGEVVAELLAL